MAETVETPDTAVAAVAIEVEAASASSVAGADPGLRWLRRARPLLGTLVELAVGWQPAEPSVSEVTADAGFQAAQRQIEAGFACIAQVQAALSRFEPGSVIARFNAAPAGARLALGADAVAVLLAAHELQLASAGAFDISLGSAPGGWRVLTTAAADQTSAWLLKTDAACRLDLGGIAKGHAIDRAVAALQAAGAASGWVNAGGDLRVFGAARVPLHLRDESNGGTRPFGWLSDGAMATSHFAPGSRSALAMPAGASDYAFQAHLSVAAPLALWADALTKVVAQNAPGADALLACFQAHAWWHGAGGQHRSKHLSESLAA